MGCVIALNTARPIPYTGDLNLEYLGLDKKSLGYDFEIYNYTPHLASVVHLDDDIANTKVRHLNTIRDKYDFDKSNVVLIDDNYMNIQKAKQNGFSVIHANSPDCGIPNIDLHSIIRE